MVLYNNIEQYICKFTALETPLLELKTLGNMDLLMAAPSTFGKCFTKITLLTTIILSAQNGALLHLSTFQTDATNSVITLWSLPFVTSRTTFWISSSKILNKKCSVMYILPSYKRETKMHITDRSHKFSLIMVADCLHLMQ
jgi:hypothetical protein